jgi:fibrillarin-like rRNA methylase
MQISSKKDKQIYEREINYDHKKYRDWDLKRWGMRCASNPIAWKA